MPLLTDWFDWAVKLQHNKQTNYNWNSYCISLSSRLYFTIFWLLTNSKKLCPPNRMGWGDILLLVRIRWHPRSFLSALYLLNQWVDFDQTGAVALLGQGKEVVRFWWPWSSFQGHTSTLNVKFWPKKAWLHPVSWTKWWILARLHVL